MLISKWMDQCVKVAQNKQILNLIFSLNKHNLHKTINVSWRAQGVLASWNSISSGVIDHVASNTTTQIRK
jgi:hypothetical protein